MTRGFVRETVELVLLDDFALIPLPPVASGLSNFVCNENQQENNSMPQFHFISMQFHSFHRRSCPATLFNFNLRVFVFIVRKTPFETAIFLQSKHCMQESFSDLCWEIHTRTTTNNDDDKDDDDDDEVDDMNTVMEY